MQEESNGGTLHRFGALQDWIGMYINDSGIQHLQSYFRFKRCG